MTRITIRFAVPSMLLTLSSAAWSDDATSAAEQQEVSEITVRAARVANQSPASSYATPATALRFDPLTELQSRGIAEGQSDVTVRGGLFENTGFKLGASTIMDPQTGHYAAELPVDPAMMSTPAIYKGIDSAVEGCDSHTRRPVQAAAISVSRYPWRVLKATGVWTSVTTNLQEPMCSYSMPPTPRKRI